MVCALVHAADTDRGESGPDDIGNAMRSLRRKCAPAMAPPAMALANGDVSVSWPEDCAASKCASPLPTGLLIHDGCPSPAPP